MRLPVHYLVAHGQVRPPTVSVPAFLAVELSVTSGDGQSHSALLRAPGASALRVAAGGTARQRLDGLQPGRYVLLIDARAEAALVVGGEPGP